MNTAEKITTILRETLEATYVQIEDESAQHVGHAGAAAGGGHYRVTIVSPLFVNKSRVACHRMVYDALAAEMQQTIHALALITLVPGHQADTLIVKQRESQT